MVLNSYKMIVSEPILIDFAFRILYVYDAMMTMVDVRRRSHGPTCVADVSNLTARRVPLQRGYIHSARAEYYRFPNSQSLNHMHIDWNTTNNTIDVRSEQRCFRSPLSRGVYTNNGMYYYLDHSITFYYVYSTLCCCHSSPRVDPVARVPTSYKSNCHCFSFMQPLGTQFYPTQQTAPRYQ